MNICFAGQFNVGNYWTFYDLTLLQSINILFNCSKTFDDELASSYFKNLIMVIYVGWTRKMNEFKDEMLARGDETFNSLKTYILAEVKVQIKIEPPGVLKEEFRKMKELESIVSVL